MRIDFTHDSVPAALPPELTLCLYRVVQEGLQNAIKYSGSNRVSFELRGHPDALALTIVDHGVGFDVSAAWGKGLGLISMNERLEALGGTVDIRSGPGAGTRLEVRVPLTTVLGEQVTAG
jgi:signal transduction histidine kinase